jgi:non-ribosomal peptide synthetase component E (peptide arylation enzyme)
MTLMQKNLGRCFDAKQSPDKVAIIDMQDPQRPREWSYAELDAECDAVARGLVARALSFTTAIAP